MVEENENMKHSGLTRRNFFQGAALGAATLGGMGLFGCSSGSAGSDASNDSKPSGSAESGTASSQAGTNTEGLYGPQLTGPEAEPIPPVAEPDTWDYEADVIWAGAGAAGCVGPWKAAKNGLSVIVIEKASYTGGTSRETNIFAVEGTKIQLEAGQAAFDLEAKLKSAAMVQGMGTKMNTPLLAQIWPKVTEAMDWMGDNGVPWQLEQECYGAPGLCWEGSEEGGFEVRASQPTLDFSVEQAEAEGVQFLLGTPALALVQDASGRIVGVKAKGPDGDIYLKGEKAVVLSTGGMENNKDLLAKYCPTALRCLNSSNGNTGDGIRMGLGAGGVVAGYDTFMAFDGGMDWNGEWFHYLYAGDVQLVRQPWLNLTKQGERYPYWSLHDVSAGAAVFQGSELLAQPQGHGYVFWDADFESNIPGFDEHMCRRPITPELADSGAQLDRIDETYRDYMNGVEQAIEAGVIKKADTIEELAEMLELNPQVISAQVEVWNKMCEAGEDPLYNYKKNWLIPIQNPPFYGAAVGATILSTATGLKFNEKMQVIAETGGVIPGLYVGGFTGGGHLGTTNNGFGGSPGGVSWSATSGYIAADAIAANE